MPEPMQLAFEERGSGPALVFVHGFPLDRTMWIQQLAGLAKVRTAIAIDLRGHGLSTDPDPGGYSMDLFAQDIAATLDGLNVDQIDLCGLSMGGYVVMAFLRAFPERVRSLILADTKAEADDDAARAGRDKAAATITEQGMDPMWDALGPKLVGASPSDEVMERLQRMILSVPPAVAAADAIAMRDRPDSTGDLPKITVPTLWIHGEEDQIMGVDAARASADTIPGARFVPIPGAGHMAPMERPEDVNDAMRAFLSDVD